MSRVSLKGICDMHVHTNPDLRLRAYNDLQLADADVRVGARAIVIKSHLGFTVNRAAIANEYVRRVYGENTGFAASTGLSAPVLFACTVLGAQSSAISPFSSGGSLILGSTPKEEDRNTLFNRLLMVAVPISVLCCAAYNFIVTMVL